MEWLLVLIVVLVLVGALVGAVGMIQNKRRRGGVIGIGGGRKAIGRPGRKHKR